MEPGGSRVHPVELEWSQVDLELEDVELEPGWSWSPAGPGACQSSPSCHLYIVSDHSDRLSPHASPVCLVTAGERGPGGARHIALTKSGWIWEADAI